MHYKGELIKDAGEAHKVFLTVMKRMEEESEQQRKSWSPWRDPLMMFAIGLCVGLAWSAT